MTLGQVRSISSHNWYYIELTAMHGVYDFSELVSSDSHIEIKVTWWRMSKMEWPWCSHELAKMLAWMLKPWFSTVYKIVIWWKIINSFFKILVLQSRFARTNFSSRQSIEIKNTSRVFLIRLEIYFQIVYFELTSFQINPWLIGHEQRFSLVGISFLEPKPGKAQTDSFVGRRSPNKRALNQWLGDLRSKSNDTTW